MNKYENVLNLHKNISCVYNNNKYIVSAVKYNKCNPDFLCSWPSLNSYL